MTDQPADGTRFQAELGDRKIDLVIGETTVTLDGRTVPFSCERLSDRHLSLLIDGKSFSAVVLEETDGVTRVQIRNREFDVRLKTERDLLLERFGLAEAGGAHLLEVRAPMPGLVLSVAVDPGSEIEAGTGLLVLEAMKMENEIRADRKTVVKAVHVAPGDAVGKNDLLIELEQPAMPSPPSIE